MGPELFALLLILVVTFLPTIIALCRGHRNTLAIFLVNLFFGWTVIGWVIALIWSCLSQMGPNTVIVIQER